MERLAGSVVIVTGAAKGDSRVHSEALAAEGGTAAIANIVDGIDVLVNNAALFSAPESSEMDAEPRER